MFYIVNLSFIKSFFLQYHSFGVCVAFVCEGLEVSLFKWLCLLSKIETDSTMIISPYTDSTMIISPYPDSVSKVYLQQELTYFILEIRPNVNKINVLLSFNCIFIQFLYIFLTRQLNNIFHFT